MSAPSARTPPTVVLWCATGTKVGRGHLSRCLNLADELRTHGAEVTFVPAPLDDASEAWVRQRGHGLVPVPATGDPRQAFDPATWARAFRADWVVIDSYQVTSDEIADCAEQSQVLVVDDLNDRDLSAASIVVNPTPGSELWSYRLADHTRLLAGLLYALVHRAFRHRRDRGSFDRRFPVRADRIAVALGGTDSEGRTEAVLSHLGGWDEPTIRVAGEAVEIRLPNVEHLGFVDQEALADLMEWCDLFIATPSSLTWELATLRVPAAFVQTVPNQQHIAEFLRDSAGLVVVGIGEPLLALNEVRASATRRRAAADALGDLCDGLGAERVARAMLGF